MNTGLYVSVYIYHIKMGLASGGGPVHAHVPIQIYMQLVTTASCDQHLVATTHTQTFYKNKHYFCLNIKYLYMQLIILMKRGVF